MADYQLYLIRHGVAQDRGEAWPDDAKRPLASNGVSRLRKSARGLARLGVSFEDATPPRHLALPGAGGVRLHALDWGGTAAPALFLHGGRLTAQTWDYVCLGLRKQVRTVALDLRGHGDSDRTDDYGFDSHVADIGAVLDALAWPEAHLVGMSMPEIAGIDAG